MSTISPTYHPLCSSWEVSTPTTNTGTQSYRPTTENTSGNILHQVLIDSLHLSLLSPPGLATRFHSHITTPSALDLLLGIQPSTPAPSPPDPTWEVITSPCWLLSPTPPKGHVQDVCHAGTSPQSGRSMKRHRGSLPTALPFPWKKQRRHSTKPWRRRVKWPSALPHTTHPAAQESHGGMSSVLRLYEPVARLGTGGVRHH